MEKQKPNRWDIRVFRGYAGAVALYSTDEYSKVRTPEAKQTGCKGYGGHSGAVTPSSTDEYSKVNKTPKDR